MKIWTTVGEIAVNIKRKHFGQTPVIFLHGVYFDHHLWDYAVSGIGDRTIITVDMPLHGKSRPISNADWTLDDCATMLMDILNKLEITKVIAVGHSWGSMTILRAAHREPDRFERLLLCNMPFHAANKKLKFLFFWQHHLLAFRTFYMNQAAKSLFDRRSLANNPGLMNEFKRTMSILSGKDIKQVDQKVILEAKDTSSLIRDLKMKATAVRGETDYVPINPYIETFMVKGGYISPLEAPEALQEILMNELSKQ